MSAITPGRILLIDDDPEFVEAAQDRLVRQGYEVQAAPDRTTALVHMSQDDAWDVILLDIKLRGKEGPDDGLDLMGEIQVRAPSAKIIMVTGLAEERTVQPAFAAGAYDYLDKGGRLFISLLLAKVRNATEAVRERRMGLLGAEQRETELRRIWQVIQAEQDRHRKGALLEDLLLLLFRSLPGFGRVTARRQNEQEEIDLVIPNESADPLWSREGQYLLGECKNWSTPVGKNEYLTFRHKVAGRFGRCRLGFFIAVGGFAKTFHTEQLTARKDDVLVLPIGREDLNRLIHAPSIEERNDLLKAFHERATLAEHLEPS